MAPLTVERLPVLRSTVVRSATGPVQCFVVLVSYAGTAWMQREVVVRALAEGTIRRAAVTVESSCFAAICA
jgi:hypothetical protein